VNPSASIARRFAIGLLNVAVRLLPKSRTEWARAMRSEMHYLENDRRAVFWAAGCCLASIKEKVTTMRTGNLRISSWLWWPEMMLSFVPLSIAWLDSLFGPSGIFRLNVEVIHRYFIGAPSGETVLATMISGAILGVLGPIGLVTAFRVIVLHRPIRNPLLCTTLMVGPLLYGVLTLGFRFAIWGPAAFGLAAVDAFDFWSGALLLSLLPALGAAHLVLFGPGRSAGSVAA
jgi:hypothetical protein